MGLYSKSDFQLTVESDVKSKIKICFGLLRSVIRWKTIVANNRRFRQMLVRPHDNFPILVVQS